MSINPPQKILDKVAVETMQKESVVDNVTKSDYRKLFEIARSSLLDFSYAVWLIYEHKAWEPLGYDNFEVACIEILGISKSTASKYKTIAEGVLAVLRQDEKFHSVKQITKIGDSVTLEHLVTDKMRNLGEFVSRLGMRRSYELISCPGVDIKAVAEGGNPLYVNNGIKKEITVEDIKSAKNIKILVSELVSISSSTPTPQAQAQTPAKPVNPVNQARQRLDRYIYIAGELKKQVETERHALQGLILEQTEDLRKQLATLCTEVSEFITDEKALLQIVDVNATEPKPEKKLPANEFIEVAELAEFTGLSDSYIRRLCRDRKIEATYLKKGKDESWLIHPDGLPEEHRKAFYSESAKRAETDERERLRLLNKDRDIVLNEVAKSIRKKALNDEYCIRNFGHLQGDELTEALQKHQEEYPEYDAIPYSTFKRKLKAYQAEGIRGIIDWRGVHRRGETKVTDEDFEYYKAQRMNENGLSSPECWKEVRGRAIREGRITYDKEGVETVWNKETGEEEGSFPCAATFERLYVERTKEAARVLATKGAHRAKQTIHFPHVATDPESILPGQLYVMDHHTTDILCKPSDVTVVKSLVSKLMRGEFDSPALKSRAEKELRRHLKSGLSKKKTVRLWLTNCMDFRTRKQLGWYLHEHAPCTADVMYTFMLACKYHGYPEALLLDNGKDFRSKHFAGKPFRNRKTETSPYNKVKIESVVQDVNSRDNVATGLGIRVIWAGVKQSQAKPIERQYRFVCDGFSKRFKTYTGSKPHERPEATSANIKKGDIPLVVDIIEIFDNFIKGINSAPQGGKYLDGKSPDQLWVEKHPGKRMPGEAALFMMMLKMGDEKKLTAQGYSHPALGGYNFWNDQMMGDSGRKVYARWDPEDWEKCYIFDAATDVFLYPAELQQLSPMMPQTAEGQQIFQEILAQKKRHQKLISAEAKSMKMVSGGESFENVNAHNQAFENTWKAVHEMREDGAKPVTLTHNKLDEIGRNILSYKDPGDKDLSGIVPKEQPKSGKKIKLLQSDPD